jgi:hypothetical protein
MQALAVGFSCRRKILPIRHHFVTTWVGERRQPVPLGISDLIIDYLQVESPLA